MNLLDPVKLALETKKLVTRGIYRKYYRTFRPGSWYGGIATADCCGCCLRCVFCWSGAPRNHPDRIGKFYSPEHIFKRLVGGAERFSYTQLRVSGNEPTMGKKHLLKLLELIDQTNYSFILESNGVLLGYDVDYAKKLSKFENVHVRISIKGTNEEEFSMLTGAKPEGFNLQLKSLKNLLDAGVSCHPAVMLSFSSKKNYETLKEKLSKIDSSLAGETEEEYVFLYPIVVDRLNKAGIKPKTAYTPNRIPSKLI